MVASRVAHRSISAGDRLARGAERLLRLLGDARTGLVLLLLTGLANAVVAAGRSMACDAARLTSPVWPVTSRCC